ncbi:DUF4861 domain-containing protein [Salegentibacter sp. LM13S]|uniref:DUF4861 domain-containing protein n=1 Tax=Salegentibacter lacus TaxID=2873599 RepID=UPI001CCA5A3C|nr:DUF4861 domain-containing protein [Salegentibacter lacus]MBZ9630067.1 DUF4861 domain-containing protein [Salegentibacter lacus]
MMTKRASLIQIIIFILLLSGCKSEEKSVVTEILLINTSNIELSEKAVVIERAKIFEAENEKYPVLTSASDTIPSQLTDLDWDGEWDELFFLANFSAEERKTFELHWVDEEPQYTTRTSVRFGKRESVDEPVTPATEETLTATDMPKNLGFQKYQTDGPTWENDKVGFRHYLDGRNSKDIFGKTSANISPETVGVNDTGAVEDNYHTMEDWGRDIFPVGNSVGLGGFALLVDNEVQRLGITVDDTLSNIEETTFRILEEGPLKSIMKFEYNNWDAADNTYNAEEVTTIWAGMYGFKNTVSVSGMQNDEVLLIGLSNINIEKPLQEVEVGDFVALILHDYQTYEREWALGTALLIPKADYNGYIEAPEEGKVTSSYLVKTKRENGNPISYYAIAAGEMAPDGGFEDAETFRNYVEDLARQLSATVEVVINSSENE